MKKLKIQNKLNNKNATKGYEHFSSERRIGSHHSSLWQFFLKNTPYFLIQKLLRKIANHETTQNS